MVNGTNNDDRNSCFGCRAILADFIFSGLRYGAFHSRSERKRSALSSGHRRGETIPRPGVCCAQILQLLQTKISARQLEDDTLETLQDPYSLRCAPQVVGVFIRRPELDKEWVEIEANSSNDNPIFRSPRQARFLWG